MHFISFKDTPQQQLAHYAKLYQEKFPLAFQEEQEPEESGEESEEPTLVWREDHYEKEFRDFDAKIKKVISEKSPLGLLSTLYGMKAMIEELPVSTKEAEWTIQRFMLYLLPIFNMCGNKDLYECKQLFVKFMDLIVDSAKLSVPNKVTNLLYAFNATKASLKATVFVKLLQLTAKEGCFDILEQRARAVVQDSADWNISTEERRELYHTVAQVLISQNDHGAFHIMYAYCSLFEKATKEELAAIEKDVHSCVVLAVKAPSVVNFEELQDMKALKSIQEKEAYKFLDLFTSTSAKDFSSKLSQFEKLMKTENISREEAIQKKSYV